MRRFTLRLAAVVLLAIGTSAGLAATASAEATVTHSTITVDIHNSGLTHDCLPGVTGTLLGTGVFTSQLVQTPQGVHVVTTEVRTGRIDWSNGMYTILDSIDHDSGFNAPATGTTVLTQAGQDSANFYSADGVFLFQETFHEIIHFTITNGDITQVRFDTSHSHLFGEC